MEHEFRNLTDNIEVLLSSFSVIELKKHNVSINDYLLKILTCVK